MKYQQAMTKWGVCAAMIFGVGLMAQPNVRAEEPTSTPAQSTTDTAKKNAKKTTRPRLDVVFTVDATSSMSD